MFVLEGILLVHRSICVYLAVNPTSVITLRWEGIEMIYRFYLLCSIISPPTVSLFYMTVRVHVALSAVMPFLFDTCTCACMCTWSALFQFTVYHFSLSAVVSSMNA